MKIYATGRNVATYNKTPNADQTPHAHLQFFVLSIALIGCMSEIRKRMGLIA